MKYQQSFASIYSRPPPRRAYPPLGHGDLVRLAAPLWEVGERLGLPQLEPWQRKELGEAELPELRPLLLAYGQLFAARPEIARALGLTAAFVESLRRKEVAIGSLVDMLEKLLTAVTDARYLAVAELHHQITRAADAARRLGEDESLAPAERDAELASFGSVRRLREEGQKRQKRSKRRTERRLEPLRDQLRTLSERMESARLAAELRGDEGAGSSPLPAPEGDGGGVAEHAPPARRGAVRVRWIGSDRAGELLQSLRRGGTPLERCLSADPEEIDACAAEVGRIKAGLGGAELSPEERRELAARDALRECNLALAYAQALRGSKLVTERAGVTPRALEDGCQILLALDRLELATSLLLRDAHDGRIALVGMVTHLHQRAQGWLADTLDGELGEEERRRLLGDYAATLSLAEQAGERIAAKAARVERRASELEAQVAEAKEAARRQETVDRLRAGEAVPRDELLRAARPAGLRRTKRR